MHVFDSRTNTTLRASGAMAVDMSDPAVAAAYRDTVSVRTAPVSVLEAKSKIVEETAGDGWVKCQCGVCIAEFRAISSRKDYDKLRGRLKWSALLCRPDVPSTQPAASPTTEELPATTEARDATRTRSFLKVARRPIEVQGDNSRVTRASHGPTDGDVTATAEGISRETGDSRADELLGEGVNINTHKTSINGAQIGAKTVTLSTDRSQSGGCGDRACVFTKQIQLQSR
jgi:hypothetical protein